MKYLVRFGSVFLMVLLVGCASQGGGDDSASNMAEGSGGEVQMKSGVAGVMITKPAPMSDVTSPFEVCIDTMGYTVEPAKNGVNEGKGHHHLIIDADLPDLSQPIPKDEQHIHMGDGSTCKTVELPKGKMYTIKALFARGNHVPYDPAVTSSVVVFVK
ncbi:MAG: DUF4399 domain-containing protein [Nitrospinota bacterium]|jgi:hypothetical protein|nr:DUF4399 domain-containing protein [Nitrospinota bacterium]